MDANKIVEKIVDEAFERAEREGHDERKYVYATGTLMAYMRYAIESIESRDCQWFFQKISEYDVD